MANVLIISRDTGLLTAFVAGVQFVNDSAVEVIRVQDYGILLRDDDREEDATYELTLAGGLNFLRDGIEVH